ncbi:DgyrCDS6695 [Dimorphilus gyrociliatus]|uniref:DgyrCDS6695 n=1 Tax=Dimorphilus gyrociliatus TaxID=2664684 RepID=A0A7I8VTM0_9ANNE|nr:DgyrCDS6695 [Dimorphilus gyrociliatus]
MAALARTSVNKVFPLKNYDYYRHAVNIVRLASNKDDSSKYELSTRKFKHKDDPEPDLNLFRRTRPDPAAKFPEKEVFPGEFSLEKPKGKIYDKKPFKIFLEAGKTYSYCTCGWSRSQPFCDGQHRRIDGTSEIKRTQKFRPIRFTVEKSKEYWLCNCKQSNNRPYCDGTHKRQDIQDAIRS